MEVADLIGLMEVSKELRFLRICRLHLLCDVCRWNEGMLPFRGPRIGVESEDLKFALG